MAAAAPVEALRSAPMSDQAFEFTWKIDGTSADELCAVLADVEHYARWWPAAFAASYEVEPGGDDESGRVVAVESKGFLPSVLRWSLRTRSVQRPERVEFETFGDLEGEASWEVQVEGATTVARWRWRGTVHRPLLRLFASIFARDQAWAFARGEESVALELARRRARSDEARARIDAPPGPTSRSPLPFTLGLSGVVGVVVGAAVLLVRRPKS